MSDGFYVTRLDDSIDREQFECGKEPLNRYFKQQATQDIRRRVAFCFVAADDEGVIGYYTLASATVSLSALQLEVRKRLPKYGEVPCVLLGRLAVATTRQGQGYGSVLLADALHKALNADIAAHAMLTDPKDVAAEAFYAKHGFIRALESDPSRMYLSLVTATNAAQRAQAPAAPPR